MAKNNTRILFGLLFVCLSSLIGAEDAKLCKPEELNCVTCRDPKTTNALQGYPRFSYKGDMSVYIPEGTAIGNLSAVIMAKVNPSALTAKPTVVILGNPEDQKDIVNYLASFAPYMLFLVVTILVAVLMFCFCCGRYVLACCCKGGCCGGIYPTMGGCCGYSNKYDPPRYTYLQKGIVYAMALAYFVLMLVFILQAYTGGVRGIPDGAVKLATTSTDGIANLIGGLSEPVIALLDKTLNPSIKLLITTLTTTINTAVNMTVVIADIQCVARIMTDNLPNITTINVTMTTITSALKLLPKGADVDEIIYRMGNATKTINSTLIPLKGLVTDLGDLKKFNFDGNFTQIEAQLNSTKGHITKIGSLGNDTKKEFETGITPLTKGTEIDTIINFVSNLGYMGNNAGSANRTAFTNALNALKDKIGKVGPAIDKIGELLKVNISREINSTRDDLTALGVSVDILKQPLNKLPNATDINNKVDALSNGLNLIPFNNVSNIVNNMGTLLITIGGVSLKPIKAELNKVGYQR